MDGYWFKSDLFEIEHGEDEETNPGCYGRQLSHWLKDKFSKLGYEVEDVIPEDWGWCVMCVREPYMLWVGCGSIEDDDDLEKLPEKKDVVWHCFVTAEVPFLKRLFKKVDTTQDVKKLTGELESIINSEPGIQQLEEP